MRARPVLAVVLLLALAVGLAGCGGDDGGEAAPTSADTAAETTGAAGGTTLSGDAIFVENCGGCHTLAAAGTQGAVGPNLDDLAPDADTVAEQVRNGGGGMPSFEGKLSDDEIDLVAEFVASSAAG